MLGSGITALGVLRILARDGIQAYVANVTDPLLRKSRWYRPLPGVPDKLPSKMKDWLAHVTVPRAVLIPCSDHWVSAVGALEPEFRTRFPSSVASWATLAQLVDKGRFAALLREAHTPHPWTQSVESDADIDAIPDFHFEHAILKPCDSQNFMDRFGVKALHVHSRAQAATELARLRAEGFPVVLQEYVSGPPTNHYFVDGFIDRTGFPRAIFVRRRLRMYPSDFGNSTAMVSVSDTVAEPAVAAVTALLRRAKYRGVFSAEFKLDDRDHRFKLLEINARPWWFIEFAARCGVDVCRMAYDDALERPVQTIEHYATGRALVFPYLDYFACADSRRRGELSLFEWTRSWATSIQPVFQLRDPMPGLIATTKVLATFLQRRVRRLI